MSPELPPNWPNIEALSAQMDQAPPILIQVEVAPALMLIGMLQLALRHPEFGEGPTAKACLGFIETLATSITDRVPEASVIIQAGFNPDFDVSRGDPHC